MQEKAKAAKDLHVLNWIGMESDQEYGEIVEAGEISENIRIIRPFADHDRILKEIKFAEEHDALAVGIDIDHVPGSNGKYDVVDGIPLGPITEEDLKQYAASTELPFIAKGVLSVKGAMKAADAGCDAYKALAIGADGVLIGRGILPELLKDGTQGVENKVKQMNEQLSQLMLYTGIKDTNSFDPTVLHF